MVDKECNLRAGVYKVQTFGTTHCCSGVYMVAAFAGAFVAGALRTDSDCLSRFSPNDVQDCGVAANPLKQRVAQQSNPIIKLIFLK